MNGVLLVSAIAGFFVSIISIFSGLGLWSIILGLLSRAFISLFGSLFFVIYIVKDFVRPHLKISKFIFFEFAKVAPASSLGGISYAIMNQSETALVAIFIRPEVAAVLNLTRKAADVGRSFIDTIGYASYGGFAHLVGSKQRSNIFKVYTEIQSFQISASIAIAAAYMAVNQSLVEVWVGKNQYGGNILTILMALQIVLNTRSTLNNSLYRATGSIITGSIAQFLECLLRVPLIIGFILWFGLAGVPTASIITSIFSSYMLYKMTIKEFQATEIKLNNTSNSIFFARLLIFIFGVLSCLALYEPNWLFVVSVGSLFFLFSFLFLVFIDPNLNDTKIFFVGIKDKLLHRFCIK
jgi:O-antigen/teichoic acid export membrane protein